MLQHYFKIARRNFFTNKLSSLINVSGLAIGMSVAMLIGLWVFDELSFNKVHKNYDRIVQVMDHQSREGRKNSNVYLPIPLAKVIRSGYNSDFKYVTTVRQTEEHILVAGDKRFTQPGNYMESDGPEMFSLDMIRGNRNGLKEPNSILLSATLASKFFGNDDPINKIITVDANTDVKVTGVFSDLPHNSQFSSTTFILPFELFGADKDEWNNYCALIYAQLNEQVITKNVSSKIQNVLSKHVTKKNATHDLFLNPMSEWHLYSGFENHARIQSEKLKLIWFYGMIAAVVLLLACINFMNLSTARSERRAKEVGIRKAVGSLRKQLIFQFFGESLLISFCSILLSISLVQLALPWFNKIAGKDISILWSNPWFWIAGLGFAIVTGVFAGSYPALYLSSFNPVTSLKGTFRVGKYAALPRKVMVVLQFSASIALIIGTTFVYLQIQHAKNRPAGYSQAGLINLFMVSPEKYEVIKSEFINSGNVKDVARANYQLTNTLGSNGGFYWEGKLPVEGQSFNTIRVSQEYGKTVGWELLQGRDFLKGRASDSACIILNESAVIAAGLREPIGQTVKWQPGTEEGKLYTIIGVVKDMVKNSPFQDTEPSVIFLGNGNWLFARLTQNANMHHALSKLGSTFNKIFPDLPFDYRFADEEYGAKFSEEERVSKIASLFAALAIFISCLGLLGLSSFIAEQRKKEIGIRKVLGASVFSIWGLLSKQFATLILVSCFLAVPVTHYYITTWLENYSYRISLSAWVFFAGGTGSLLTALIVVSYQSINAALSNPVDSIRRE